MAFLKQLGVERHHYRSASAEMGLVMELLSSETPSTIDQLPIPHAHRSADKEADIEPLFVHKVPSRQRSASCTMTAPNNKEYSTSLNENSVPHNVGNSGHSKNTPVTPTLGHSPEFSNAEDRGTAAPQGVSIDESKSMQMSIVSPPFTPISSQVDLSKRLESPEPITLPSSTATAQLRSTLDDVLPTVFCESRARIPTTNGEEIFLHVYRNNVDSKEHLAIVFGQDIHSRTLFQPREGETEHDRMTRGAYTGRLYPGRSTSGPESELPEYRKADEEKARERANQDVLCRIHSECYTGETAWSARCDCGEQLDEAARLMSEAGRGVIVYLRQEGRGIGLGEKLKAYNLQDLGADTVQANLLLRHPADGRTFGLATAILLDLGLDHIRLMTNNPDKIIAVEGKNKEITVTKRVPMIPLSWQKKGGFQSEEVDKYLATKIERMGHLLDRS